MTINFIIIVLASLLDEVSLDQMDQGGPYNYTVYYNRSS